MPAQAGIQEFNLTSLEIRRKRAILIDKGAGAPRLKFKVGPAR